MTELAKPLWCSGPWPGGVLCLVHKAVSRDQSRRANRCEETTSTACMHVRRMHVRTAYAMPHRITHGRMRMPLARCPCPWAPVCASFLSVCLESGFSECMIMMHEPGHEPMPSSSFPRIYPLIYLNVFTLRGVSSLLPGLFTTVPCPVAALDVRSTGPIPWG